MEKSISKLDEQKGFTLIEVIVASLVLTLIVAAVVQYHTSAGVSKGQQYYLKAVKTATTELDKLRALYELKYDDSTVTEFDETGLPTDIFLFKFTSSTSIDLPSPIYHVYYSDHGYSGEFLKSIGANNTVKDYHQYYEANYVTDTDDIDGRTFTYLTDDGNTVTGTNGANGQVDASIVVIDDMGSPEDREDDLIGNIGWWVEDVSISGTVYLKKITFALQFWYPGQDETEFDPEVIVLKTTLVKP